MGFLKKKTGGFLGQVFITSTLSITALHNI